MRHSKNSEVAQLSLFTEGVEDEYIRAHSYRGMDLESAMEITMYAWDLVKDVVRSNAPEAEKKRRKSRESCIMKRE